MKYKQTILLAGLGLVLSTPTRSGPFDHKPIPPCREPSRYGNEDYTRQAADYLDCLAIFIREQQAAIKDHTEAADYAASMLVSFSMKQRR